MCGNLGGKNMYREFIIFAGIVVVSLFMTIHSHNKQAMRDSEIKLSEQRSSQENLLMQEGDLIKLDGGITLTKSADLIIIKQSNSTIILNESEAREIIAFLGR